MRTALTIAGSDSGGGAGIQADLKTFAAHGVYGLSALTAVTAQNTTGVTAVHALPPEIVIAQIEAVAADFDVAATKIGMLANAAIAGVVADALDAHRFDDVVLDPVMIAKGGAPLVDEAAIAVLRDRLLPRATVVTPNLAEAARLLGRAIVTIADMRTAAQDLRDLGARAVVVKGGHLDGPAVDVFADAQGVVELSSPRVPGRHRHGTGCTFSAAIAARLARGEALRAAVEGAKAYVTRAIADAPNLGRGHGPLEHFPREPGGS